MYNDIFTIFVIVFWLLSLMFSIVFCAIFFDRLFKKQNKDFDNALINLNTSLGVLSALVFFSYENFSKIENYNKFNTYIHIVSRIFISFSFSFLIIYLISKIKYIIKNSIKRNKQEDIINIEKKSTDLSYSLLSKPELFLVLILSVFLFIVFSIYKVF